MIERVDLKSLITRMNEPSGFIQVVVGPRQVGKTTMVNQLLSRRGRE
jgi:predicted AAA+ superfamily ATPase